MHTKKDFNPLQRGLAPPSLGGQWPSCHRLRAEREHGNLVTTAWKSGAGPWDKQGINIPQMRKIGRDTPQDSFYLHSEKTINTLFFSTAFFLEISI
jgi:hypothetical protein